MSNKIAHRVDRMALRKLANAPRRADGSVQVTATVKTPTLLVYPEHGTREYAPAAELARAEFLESLRDIAVTVDHPREDIGPGERRAHQIGHVSGPGRFDAARGVEATLVLTDAPTIASVDMGDLVEVSLGYACVFGPPGTTPDGEPYDLEQRSIVANHVALVGQGEARGGPATRLRLDSSKSQRLTAQKAETMEEQIAVLTQAETVAPGITKRIDSKTVKTGDDVRRAALAEVGFRADSLATASSDYLRGAFDAAAALAPAQRDESALASARMDAGARDLGATDFDSDEHGPTGLEILLHNV